MPRTYKKRIYKKGYIPWNKGKKTSIEQREKMRQSHLGKKMSEFQKKRMTESLPRGENHWAWKGGISTYERKLYQNNQRRALKLNAPGQHTQGEWETLKTQYGHRCPSCLRTAPEIVLTEDHIIPLSKGGSNYIENIQPLCRSCNSKKYTNIVKY